MNHVHAHAHLAAIGWATMMVVGVGYRMLPMVLPAAMPTGATLYVSAALLEGAALGLFVSLATGSQAVVVFAGVAVAGFAVFLGHVAWMMRHPRPAPAALPRPDVAVGHALAALASLAGAAAIGVTLAVTAPSALSLRLVSVYGVLGLVMRRLSIFNRHSSICNVLR